MEDGIGTTNNPNAEGDEEYFATMPPGIKFDPDDHQIVVDYLMPRIKGQSLPRNKIREVNVYKYNPEDLTALYDKREDKAWFFLTSRDRKYANGKRPNRVAGRNKPVEGYWKAIASVLTVRDKDSNELGKRRALVFYRGKPKKGTKTDWIMHEFTANYDTYNSEPVKDKNADKMRLDDWVVCKVYQKPNKGSKGRPCAVKDNQARTEESASPPATPVNDDSSVVPEFNNSGYSIGPHVDDFQNLWPSGSLSPATLSGFHSINRNLMTTNVDKQSSNHHLHLEAARDYSTHPSSSLIDPPSPFPDIDFVIDPPSPLIDPPSPFPDSNSDFFIDPPSPFPDFDFLIDPPSPFPDSNSDFLIDPPSPFPASDFDFLIDPPSPFPASDFDFLIDPPSPCPASDSDFLIDPPSPFPASDFDFLIDPPSPFPASDSDFLIDPPSPCPASDSDFLIDLPSPFPDSDFLIDPLSPFPDFDFDFFIDPLSPFSEFGFWHNQINPSSPG